MGIRRRFGLDAGETIFAGLGLVWIAFWIACIAAWITHIITCIQTEQYLLLIAGGLIAPIGVVHGWGLWFGIF